MWSNKKININSSFLQRFDKAAADVKALKSTPSDNDLLEVYAFFKQGSVGDCNTGNTIYNYIVTE